MHFNNEGSVALSVVIPIYNEESTVSDVVDRVVLSPYSKQIIIVDDGSSDATGDLLRGRACRPDVLVLTHGINRGKSRAIRTGLEAAVGEYTIIQDADLEYDPADYPAIIEPLVRGEADLVLGSRYMRGNRSGAKWSFRAGVETLNLVVALLYGVWLTDEATCYKAIRTDTLRRMDLRCERFEFCPEVVAKACRMGLRITEVPISYHPRTTLEGKKIRLRDGISALRTLWRWRKWVPAAAPAANKNTAAPSKASPVVAGGFTLVELLVVLGIIALLIALLMPAVVRTQQQAARVACLAHLRAIGQAANSHAHDHLNHLPICGWHYASDPSDTSGAHLASPEGLNDTGEKNFIYYTDSGLKRPVPITAALAIYLRISVDLGSRQGLITSLDGEDIKAMFRCPALSAKQDLSGLTQRDNADKWTAPAEFSSYVFNEAALGRRSMKATHGNEPPIANLARIRQSSLVMFAMDGFPRNQDSDNWLTVFDRTPEDTLYDFQQNILTGGWGKQIFDHERHQGTINILFLDGHAENISMAPNSLKTVGVSKGIYR